MYSAFPQNLFRLCSLIPAHKLHLLGLPQQHMSPRVILVNQEKPITASTSAEIRGISKTAPCSGREMGASSHIGLTMTPVTCLRRWQGLNFQKAPSVFAELLFLLTDPFTQVSSGRGLQSSINLSLYVKVTR